MPPIREEIHALQQNGITRVAMRRIGDPDVIALWFGEGDEQTDRSIVDAAIAALDDGFTFYGHMRGRAELRTAIREYHQAIYGLDIDDSRITVPGSSMLAVTLAAQMTLSDGDHAVLVGPYWPNIDRAVRVTGASFTAVRQRLTDRNWYLDIEDVRAAIQDNTRALYINSPSNPTGWVMSHQTQQALLELCRAHDITIIADEVYHRTVYDQNAAPSFLQDAGPDDSLLVINGFSKAYAMTGWRLGWMVVPEGMTEQMNVLSECFNTSAPSFIQRAGITALSRGEAVIQRLREQYRVGRDIVMEELAPHPAIDLPTPQGAFYAFPRLHGLNSSLDFVNAVLDEENVGLAPGYTFGPDNEAHFRLCFAQSHTRLREALHRITRFIDRHAGSLP